MKTGIRILVAAAAVALAGAVAQAQQPVRPDTLAARLANAKQLYASASYEEALAQLDLVAPAEATAQIEQYRALCFLALNRTADAERSLEQIVRRSPGHRMSDAEVSPRLVAMYSDVRRRVLPLAAKETYARARWSYQGGDYVAASADLRQLLALLNDPDLSDAPRDVLDLKLVAEGFLKLAEAELSRQPASAASVVANPIAPEKLAPPPPVAAPPAESSANGGAPRSTRSGPARIYNDDDRDVKAPIELERRMPLWTPPDGFTEREFRGVLELVIDESGGVISVVSLGAIMPNYDEALRAAARQWKYRPAMLRDGTPVRYRLLVGYLLKPVNTSSGRL
jgi:tetratricopeptide (TPR) repeat protein